MQSHFVSGQVGARLFISAVTGLLFLVSFDAEAQNATVRINATVPGISGSVCVRAIIKKADGAIVSGEWGDSSWPNVSLRGKAFLPETAIQVPPGITQITVGKGADYLPQTITTNLLPLGDYTINVQLQPVLDLYGNGWRAGDLHTHFNHGDDEIRRTPQQVFAMSAAGGLNFVSLCQEHFGATTLSRQQMFDAWQPYGSRECKMWLGAEEPKNGWGHHSGVVFDPWAIHSPVPYWQGINQIHAQGGVSFPVHPQRDFPDRNDNGWSVYPYNNYFKAFPLHTLIGHLLDGWSGVSDQAHAPTLLPPYFKLLDLGYKIPLLADSDVSFDRINNGNKAPGFWLNYVYLGGQEPTHAGVAQAIRNGRVMATTGPLVLFTIDGALPGESLPADGATRRIRIQASYAFNPWTLTRNNFAGTETCRVEQIDLFRNGKILKTWNPNTPNATVELPINETASGSYYMVRVVGNDAAWAAGYASPIYFDAAPRARQPSTYTSLIKGRVYNAASGTPLPATITSHRNGETLWTLTTDSQGRFQAYAPLDSRIVARDHNGREFSRDIMNDERVYAFCHNLRDNYQDDLGASIEPFKQLVREMEWEFPIGYQHSGSYVRAPLSGEGLMSAFSVVSTPPPTAGKATAEIVMLLIDKTQAQPGDTINYAVIFRHPLGGVPSDELSVEWKGWDPNFPRMFTKLGRVFHQNNTGIGKSLGNGFYVKQGSAVVPSWAANVDATSPGIKMIAIVRGSRPEEANLLVPIGPTKKELLVSTTWDGFPATWGDRGIGPCGFHRQLTKDVRYTDYRNINISLRLNDQLINVRPGSDTAHAADADDAVFQDFFYYDGQCEPQFRNIQFRTPPRPQPAVSFAGVPIFNSQERIDAVPLRKVPLPIPSGWFGANNSSQKIIFWQHKVGYTAATHLSGTNFVSSSLLRDGQPLAPEWVGRGVGDFNRDGEPDIVWQHSSGSTAVWYMRGAEFLNAAMLRNGLKAGSGWTLRAVADMDGDRNDDFVWQHCDGRSAVWYMNGSDFVRTKFLINATAVGPGWKITGAGDFNSDSFNDLLWYHDSGVVNLWLMNNTRLLGTLPLRDNKPAGTGWKVVGVADLNQDLRNDLLWQSSSGAMAAWFMNNARFLRAGSLVNGRAASTGWRIIGTR